jgi:PST family polysaccharide transporter
MQSDSLSTRLFRGSLWSVLAEILSTGLRALSFIAYARLLTPADFGLVGFSLLWVSLFPLIIDNSIGLTVINSKDDSQLYYSTAFWMNISLSIAGILALWLGSNLAINILHDRRIALILPLMGLQILFNSLCATHSAIARKTFQFARLVPAKLISTIVSLAIGLWLALHGFGYWSLVTATITASCTQMILTWFAIPWRPLLHFSLTKAKGMTSFTSWTVLDMGITWLVMSGGGFFLAFYLGVTELGLFRLADQVDTIALGTIINPLLPVVYSAFCEVAGDKALRKRVFLQLNRVNAIMTIFLAGSIISVAYPLEALVGRKWVGIGEIITINAVADIFGYIVMFSPSFLRATGNSRVVAIMRLALLVGQIAVYSTVAKYGVVAFLYGKLFLEAVMYCAICVAMAHQLEIARLRLIADQGMLLGACGVTVCAGTAASFYIMPQSPFGAICAGITTFVLSFSLFLGLKEPTWTAEIFSVMKKRAGKIT